MNRWIVFSGLLVLAGCAATGVKLSSHPKTGVPYPLETVSGYEGVVEAKTFNVIVIPANSSDDKSDESLALESAVINSLNAFGTKVIDRSLTSKFKDEILVSIENGSGRYSGPKDASHVLMTTVDNVEQSGDYTAAERKEDDGKVTYTAAKCSYTLKAKGNVRIYKLPELNLIEQVSIDGRDTASQENVSSSCSIPKELYPQMLKAALAKAAESKEVRQRFTPRGVVTGAYQVDEQVVFETNLNRSLGAKGGRAVSFTEQVGDDIFPIKGEGVFIEDIWIDDKRAYFTVKKDEVRAKLKLGTEVTIARDACQFFGICLPEIPEF